MQRIQLTIGRAAGRRLELLSSPTARAAGWLVLIYLLAICAFHVSTH